MNKINENFEEDDKRKSIVTIINQLNPLNLEEDIFGVRSGRISFLDGSFDNSLDCINQKIFLNSLSIQNISRYSNTQITSELIQREQTPRGNN